MRALRGVHAELRPEFALNLHDQDPRKRVGRSDRLTALALLANPFDEQLGDNDVRLRAKRLGGAVARAVRPLIGGHVSRFPEEFNPQGSGELMVRSGTSSLLLECGGWKDDPEKQFLRGVSFVALLAALESIADESYARVPLEEYESLEEEDDTSVLDVILRGGTVVVPGLEPYRADVGIEFPVPFQRENGEVASIGDLAEYVASEEVDVGGLFLHARPEALRDGGARPVLADGSPASLDVRAGPDPSSASVMTVTEGSRRTRVPLLHFGAAEEVTTLSAP